MPMTIQEVGTLVAVSARNSSRDFQRRRPGRDRHRGRRLPTYRRMTALDFHRPCLMIASSAVPFAYALAAKPTASSVRRGVHRDRLRWPVASPFGDCPVAESKTTPICGPRTTLAPGCRAGLRSPRSRRDGRALRGVRRGITVRRRMRGVMGNWSRARHRGRAPCL
jgi:hypothetical protein